MGDWDTLALVFWCWVWHGMVTLCEIVPLNGLVNKCMFLQLKKKVLLHSTLIWICLNLLKFTLFWTPTLFSFSESDGKVDSNFTEILPP